jgi:hypothetical protein
MACSLSYMRDVVLQLRQNACRSEGSGILGYP